MIKEVDDEDREIIKLKVPPLPHQVAIDAAAEDPRAAVYWPALILMPETEKLLLQFWDPAGLTSSGKPPERSVFWFVASGQHFKVTVEPVEV